MSDINKLHFEIEEIMRKFSGNTWMRSEALLQIVHRENILTGNRLRKRFGEPEIIPEAQMYKPVNGRTVQWIIDVPKLWISETGKSDFAKPTKSSKEGKI